MTARISSGTSGWPKIIGLARGREPLDDLCVVAGCLAPRFA